MENEFYYNQQEEKNKVKTSLRKAANANGLVLILFYVLVLGGVQIIAKLFQTYINNHAGFDTQAVYKINAIYELVATSWQYCIVVPLILFIFYKLYGKKAGWRLRDSYHKPQMPTKWIVKWILISIGVIYASAFISNIIWTILQAIAPFQFYAPDITASPTGISAFVNIIMIAVYAPVFEEMMFRSTLFRNTERFGQGFAVIMIGITFGLWHINYQQFIYASVMGILACFLTTKTKSVYPAMILHFILNLIGAIQSIIMGHIDMNSLSQGDITAILNSKNLGAVFGMGIIGLIIMALSVTGIILFILEIILHRDSFRFEEKRCNILTNGEKVRTYLLSPVTALAMIGMLGLTIFNILKNVI
ncbi:MAG: CPBP family intramembrane metalloprotease [Ruminococcus sp.]|nr:CPBP family intramembrane metalloprotease [Ruminococcus sp.]